MRKLKIFITALLIIAWYALIGVVIWKFGVQAGVLAWAASSIALVVDMFIPDRHTQEPVEGSCEGCKNNLGGGHCRINVEGECREGGGFELWEGAGDE